VATKKAIRHLKNSFANAFCEVSFLNVCDNLISENVIVRNFRNVRIQCGTQGITRIENVYKLDMIGHEDIRLSGIKYLECKYMPKYCRCHTMELDMQLHEHTPETLLSEHRTKLRDFYNPILRSDCGKLILRDGNCVMRSYDDRKLDYNNFLRVYNFVHGTRYCLSRDSSFWDFEYFPLFVHDIKDDCATFSDKKRSLFTDHAVSRLLEYYCSPDCHITHEKRITIKQGKRGMVVYSFGDLIVTLPDLQTNYLKYNQLFSMILDLDVTLIM
jgi:hypothetical protein